MGYFCKKYIIYILVQQQNIFWYRYSILFNLSATTKRKSLCVKVEKNRTFSTQILRFAKKKKKKKKKKKRKYLGGSGGMLPWKMLKVETNICAV